MNIAHLTDSFIKFNIEQSCFIVHINSVKLMLLNETGEMFFDLLSSGFECNQIRNLLCETSSLTPALIDADLEAFIAALTELDTNTDNSANDGIFIDLTDIGKRKPQAPFARQRYQLHGYVFEVYYPDRDSFDICHAQLCPFAAANTLAAKHRIELCPCDEGYGVFIDSELISAAPDGDYLDVHLRNAVIRLLGQQWERWLCLHAAAVKSSSDKTIVFIGASGSGKSTLSTWLSQRGYQYLGDENVIVDTRLLQLCPLPTAANLKAGAWPLFPELEHRLSQTFRQTTRPVRFLPVDIDQATLLTSHTIDYFIYLEFDDRQAPCLELLTTAEKVAYLALNSPHFGQLPDCDTLIDTLSIFCEMPSFHLRYNNFESALAALSQLDAGLNQSD